jgi:predicted peroxiredoxin
MFSGISNGMPSSLGRLPVLPYSSGMPRALVVKVTAGADDPERCNQGFTVAATAGAAGAHVSLWLTGEAAWYGVPGHAEEFALPHAQPLADLLTAVVEGGSVTVCTQCAARREIVASDLREGIRLAGSTSYVEEVLAEGAQALVY